MVDVWEPVQVGLPCAVRVDAGVDSVCGVSCEPHLVADLPGQLGPLEDVGDMGFPRLLGAASTLLAGSLALPDPPSDGSQILISASLSLLDARYVIPADFTVQVAVNLLVAGTFFNEFVPPTLPSSHVPGFAVGCILTVAGVCLLSSVGKSTNPGGRATAEVRTSVRASRLSGAPTSGEIVQHLLGASSVRPKNLDEALLHVDGSEQ